MNNTVERLAIEGQEPFRQGEGGWEKPPRSYGRPTVHSIPPNLFSTILPTGGQVNLHPGQMTRFAPLVWVEEHGRAARPVASGAVHFTGEHLSDAFPGYRNGAAQTGRLAAEALMAQLTDRAAARGALRRELADGWGPAGGLG